MLTPFLKKIAVGPHGSRNLDREEMKEAVTILLEKSVHPTQFGAFCMALRMKGETEEELTGAAEALMDACPIVEWPGENVVTVSPPLAGKNRYVPATPAAVLIASSLGARILVISDRDVPPKAGVTSSLVFESLGFPPALDFRAAARQIRSQGWSSVELSRAIPGLERLKSWRRHLGKRSFFSVVEKFVNPPRAPLLTGITHRPYFDINAALVRNLGFPSARIVQGTEGSPDPKSTGRTHYVSVSLPSSSTAEILDPRSFSLDSVPEPRMDEPPSGVSCAQWTRGLLRGTENKGKTAVVLEAGLLLHLAGVEGNLGSAVRRVTEAWEKVSDEMIKWLS